MTISIPARRTALVLFLVLSAGLLPAAEYQIDNVHSSTLFRVKHFNLGYIWGRFNKMSGKVHFDEKDAAKSSVEMTIQVDSIDTNETKRDSHLKGGDFFNAKQFPTITFKSTAVKKDEKRDDVYHVTGDLTLLGKTKSITILVQHTGTAVVRGNAGIGFETKFVIKRSDFGMDKMMGPVGDEVTLIVAVEAYQPKAEK